MTENSLGVKSQKKFAGTHKYPQKLSLQTYMIGTAACKRFKPTLVSSNWLKWNKMEKRLALYNQILQKLMILIKLT